MRFALLLLLAAACKGDAPPSESEAPDDSPTPLDEDGDGSPADQDCDDNNDAVSPGATELCDGLDNNCDGQTDEGVLSSFYSDADRDGWGAGEATLACTGPEDAVERAGDCDDQDPAYNPDAVEDDCTDPNDYNCDGSVGYADLDGDGFPACEDCDDNDGAIRPDAEEICDSRDNNCDGQTDEGVIPTWYADTDEDGYGDPDYSASSCSAPAGYSDNALDCDDSDGDIHPEATEVCNSLDDDCDQLIDDADSDLDSSSAATWYTDSDNDGYGSATSSSTACEQPSGSVADSSDCDDSSASVSPSASEICNSVDDDCDGLTDDADSSVDLSTGSTWYTDSDGDGYGVSSSSKLACSQPSGSTANASDCNDGSSSVSPSASETCNGVDDDCDSSGDEGLSCTYKLVQSDLASGLCVDDDLYVNVNGSRVYTDSVYGAQCGHVVTFTATPGQTIDIWAVDSVGGCRNMSDIYIVNVSGGVGKYLAAGYSNTCGHGASSSAFWSASVAVPGTF